jgi:hypothetical protein
MNPINEILANTLRSHQDELIANTCNRLQKISKSHYEDIDYERHVEREQISLDAFIKSIETNDPIPFSTYLQDIGNIRSSEGYRLSEVQDAVRIFEEELWLLLRKYLNAAEPLVEMLALCNRIIGAAKDHLAQAYLSKFLDTGDQVETLQKKFFKYIRENKEKKKAWKKQG